LGGGGRSPALKDRLGAVIFGTDQGTAGALLAALLEDAGQPVEGFSVVPSSVAGIIPKVQDTLIKIESWNQEKGLDHIYLFYSMQTSAASYQPHTVHLLPMDKEWLLTLKAQPWPSRSIPLFTMEWGSLFSSLIREYLFVSLFRAFAESLASENASRLASMQGAEKNIEEMLAELNSSFHQRCQMSITEELLDIVVGFEAFQEKK
jgi:F-type H+-transporting ATPase subunit gamma